MKRLVISLLMALALSLPLLAADAKPAAGTVIQVSGKPKVSMDGGKSFEKIKEGDAINAGALIKTGKGKVSILLTDGSTVRLGENTEITLKSHNPEVEGGGSIFSLAKGIGRFLVNKIGKGKHFQVETSNAVAAVKGTDWGIESNGKETKAMVFETKTGSSIEFGSLTDLQKTIIKENEQGGYDGKSFTHGDFSKEEQDKKNEDFKDLILGQVKKDEKAADQGKAPVVPEKNDDKKSDLAKIVSDELDHFNEQLAKDEKAENSARKEDREERRLVIDRNGFEALVSNRIDRPSATSVVKTVITERKAGPNAGKSGAIEATDFHAAIGDDWYKAMQMTIFDATNQEANGYPLNWRTHQNFLAFNPLGDTLEIKTDYEVPRFLGGVPCSDCGVGTVEQGQLTNFIINGSKIAYIGYGATLPDDKQTYPVAGWDGYGSGVAGYYQTSNGDIIETPQHNPYSANLTTPNLDGSVSYLYDARYLTDLFSLNVRLLDDLGRTYNAPTQTPTDISDFHGLADAVSSDGIRINVNVSITSSHFGKGHEIDLIFLPGFFDTFEFLNVPAAYQGSGG